MEVALRLTGSRLDGQGEAMKKSPRKARLTDKERLDWLAGRLCGIYKPDPTDGRPRTWEAWDGTQSRGWQGPTMRVAIDAAIRERKGRGK